MTRIAVVIPCFNVKSHILYVISKIPDIVTRVYIVDDCCPEGTANFVEACCFDKRLRIIRNKKNIGVGGAVMEGYKAAITEGMDIVVKIDGDGQMDPKLIMSFISPIIAGEADYTKGNRFFDLERIRAMPTIRLLGNAVLSFVNKLSTGYWDLFDPTNGYTAIHIDVLRRLPLEKLSKRYFFESDMLFRLNTIRAVVIDVPIDAKYDTEVSNLKISSIAFEFFIKHFQNFVKRIFYNYYLRNMSLASLQLPFGLLMLSVGGIFGLVQWIRSINTGIPTLPGTVMVSALPVILGVQFILSFIGHDISSIPKRPITKNKQNDLISKTWETIN